MLSLQDDRFCFACGEKNDGGLHLSFSWDGERLSTTFLPEKRHQGYTDVVHGGIISTILDECMAQAVIRKWGVMAATVDFHVRFRHALMVGEDARAEARVVRFRGRMVEAEATLMRRTDGAVLAEATSKLMKEEPAEDPSAGGG
jgi:uncharacterized protein (TIGR00369 family)